VIRVALPVEEQDYYICDICLLPELWYWFQQLQ